MLVHDQYCCVRFGVVKASLCHSVVFFFWPGIFLTDCFLVIDIAHCVFQLCYVKPYLTASGVGHWPWWVGRSCVVLSICAMLICRSSVVGDKLCRCVAWCPAPVRNLVCIICVAWFPLSLLVIWFVPVVLYGGSLLLATRFALVVLHGAPPMFAMWFVLFVMHGVPPFLLASLFVLVVLHGGGALVSKFVCTSCVVWCPPHW